MAISSHADATRQGMSFASIITGGENMTGMDTDACMLGLLDMLILCDEIRF